MTLLALVADSDLGYVILLLLQASSSGFLAMPSDSLGVILLWHPVASSFSGSQRRWPPLLDPWQRWRPNRRMGVVSWQRRPVDWGWDLGGGGQGGREESGGGGELAAAVDPADGALSRPWRLVD